MLEYDWPGNIRELENLMERSILLTKGSVINDIPLPKSSNQEDNKDLGLKERTIQENERIHIISILNKCGGRIRGTSGAAEILGVPPTTLASKMQKLGIKRGQY